MRALVLALAALTPAVAAAEPAGDAAPLPRGLALGVEVGEPASITARYALADGRLGVGAAVGTGTLGGPGLSVHGDLTVAVASLVRTAGARVPVELGLGVRHYRHGYAPMSVDELPDAHTGVRASLAVALVRAGSPLALYAEVAPGLDLVRTASCSYGSGVATVCPHAQASPVFVHAVVGARWYLR